MAICPDSVRRFACVIMIALRAVLVSLALLVSACADPNAMLAITDTTVINPRRATVAPHSTVLIEGGQITAVQPAAARLPGGVRKIDGRGRYLIPGLWDAHVHLSKTGSNSLPLFIANGVTGIRDMGGNLAEVQAWRDRIAAGQLAGPHIFLSGPIIESRENIDRMLEGGTVEAVDRLRIGVANAEEGRAAVRQLAAAGVDQIKMRTTPDLVTFRAVSEEARRHDLPFAAHALGTPEEMLDAGLDSVEHYLVLPPLSISETKRRTLFRRMAAGNFHVSNTAVNLRSLLTPYGRGRSILNNEPGNGDPRRKYVCGYLLEDWREQLEESREGQYGEFVKLLPGFYRDFREMHEEGVPLLAGSDSAVMFVYPGFSLHDELELMVTAMKFSPMGVLRIATDGVPAYFGHKARMGAIEAGQAADLVLLDADPLQAIGNTRRIHGVVTQGQWFDRRALDQMLAAVERDAQSDCQGGSTAGRK